MEPDSRPREDTTSEAVEANELISLEHLEQLWQELAVLARSVRRHRNQMGESYRTSDVLISAMRRLAGDRAKRLVEGSELTWETKGEFFAAAATAMHRALVDHIRKKVRAKAGGGRFKRIPLDDALVLARHDPIQLLALDECMARLHEVNPNLAELTKLKVFSPLSQEELSEMFNIAPTTVSYRWNKAKAYLAKCMGLTGDE